MTAETDARLVWPHKEIAGFEAHANRWRDGFNDQADEMAGEAS